MTGKNRNSKNDPEYSLVYSTDPIKEKKCSGCHQPLTQCNCPNNVVMTGVKPAARIERKGRGGKTVTVLFKLPAHETFLKELCSHVKRKLGTGGTHYIESGEGFVEVQGERVQELLDLANAYLNKQK